MKTVSFPASALAVLAAALVAASMPVSTAFAQNQTDAKIRLMSEALRARDAGDLAGAQKALAQLAVVSPNDPAVQKLRSEIEAQAVAQQNARAQQAAAEQAARDAAAQEAKDRAQAAATASVQPPVSRSAAPESSRPTMIDVRIPEPGQPAPPPTAAEQEADAIARAETGRIAQVIAAAQTQLSAARSQLRDGRPDDAIATIDAALATLPVNSLTQNVVADLKREKASALLERAQLALKAGDVMTARTAMAAHAQLAPANSRTASIDRQIARAEAKPVVAAVDPGFAADRAATAQLIGKGRAQYV